MIVFFFKQKTAYEMRISDWSSDVCSSDLAILPVAAAAFQQAGEQKRRATQAIQLLGAIGTHALGDILEFFGDFLLPLACCLPQLIIDDAQSGNFCPDPFRFRVDA